jgi:PKD repeat protein
MWGNSQFGDCVTAESVFAIADYSTFLGTPEIFVTEAATISWARNHGWLNGADLLSVIQDMQTDGIADENGVNRKAGASSTVNYANEATLQSAISVGPVSIAIDANALPSGAGNASGWYAFGGRSFPNTDHCVSLHGYGPTSELFKALGVSVPPGAPANGYLLYTWSTIGVVDHAWIMNTVVEAWLRTPTTTGLQPPPPPPPPPGMITVSMDNVVGGVGTPVKFSPSAKGGTSPYIFLFDYGDNAQDASGAHSYKTAGSYTVTVTAVDSTGGTGTGTCTATVGSVPPPPPPPPPGGQGTVTFGNTGTALDGTPFYLVPTTVGNMKLIDLLSPQAAPKSAPKAAPKTTPKEKAMLTDESAKRIVAEAFDRFNPKIDARFDKFKRDMEAKYSSVP